MWLRILNIKRFDGSKWNDFIIDVELALTISILSFRIFSSRPFFSVSLLSVWWWEIILCSSLIHFRSPSGVFLPTFNSRSFKSGTDSQVLLSSMIIKMIYLKKKRGKGKKLLWIKKKCSSLTLKLWSIPLIYSIMPKNKSYATPCDYLLTYYSHSVGYIAEICLCLIH